MALIDFNYEDFTARNIGILTKKQQAVLRKSSVAIAGCGADGGGPAISLARLGVMNFSLADPDNFDQTNLNRQEGAFKLTIGKNKAETIGKVISNINPDAKIKIFKEGVNEKNVKNFLNGTDLLIEEIDYRNQKSCALVHRVAREMQIPVFTGISIAWNALLFYFEPRGMSYEEYANRDYIPPSELPPYIPLKLIQNVLAGKINIPVVDPAVKMAAAMVSSFSVFYLTKIKKIKPVPYYYGAGDLLLKEPIKPLLK